MDELQKNMVWPTHLRHGQPSNVRVSKKKKKSTRVRTLYVQMNDKESRTVQIKNNREGIFYTGKPQSQKTSSEDSLRSKTL